MKRNLVKNGFPLTRSKTILHILGANIFFYISFIFLTIVFEGEINVFFQIYKRPLVIFATCEPKGLTANQDFFWNWTYTDIYWIDSQMPFFKITNSALSLHPTKHRPETNALLHAQIWTTEDKAPQPQAAHWDRHRNNKNLR